MRTKVPQALPLFRSEGQLRLLALVLLEPEREWTLAELADRTSLPVASAHRELTRAVAAGIVERDTSARPHRIRAAVESPIAEPLRELLARTVGLETELRALFAERPGIEAAAIHGSWAAGRQRRGSDVDIIAVGSESATDLRRALRGIGKRAGRRIDLTVYGRDEFARKVADDHGFLRLALDRPLVELKGDLASLAS
jgi:predicted nucleotidyltransferase